MAILASETFTLKYCAVPHLGGTILGRLEDGAICYLPMGRETNAFRRDMATCEDWNVDNVFNMYHKQYKKDKYVTVHKQGHFVQLHNRPLGEKPSWQRRGRAKASQLDLLAE